MKSLALLPLLLIAFVFVKAQDHYDASLIPAALKSRAKAIIRKQQTVVDMQAPNDVAYRVKKAITVLDRNGDDHAGLVLFYDKTIAIKAVKGEVYDEFGKQIAKFSLSDFRDESAVQGFSLFEDSRVKSYFPSVNNLPYTIVYSYEIRYKQNLIIPDWRPKPADDVAIETSNYTFIGKPNDELKIKTLNYEGKVKETVDDKQKTMYWEVNQVPAIKSEPYRPNRENYLTQVKIAPQRFSYYNYKGNYTDWKELGQWYHDALLKQRDELPATTVEFVKKLVENESSDKEKAKKIYQYVQQKTRYISVQIGIGGFQPVKAVDVDRLGYGDCKGLVNYMQALLKAVNIESYYSVVEAGSEKIDLDPTYASMNQGNHIILCLPLKNDTTWLECTSQTTPFGYLGDFTDDRYVLAVTPEGGKLMKTPASTISQNLQNRFAQLNLNDDGEINGTVSTSFEGIQYENNEHILGKPVKEQMRLLKKVYDVNLINFTAINYSQQKTQNPVLTEKLTVNIPNYASQSGNKLFLQPNIFNIQATVQEVKNRQMPMQIDRGFTDIDSAVFELPKNAKLLGALENKNITNEFGSYQIKMKIESNKLTYVRKFILNSGTFPASSYTKFAELMAEARSLDHLRLAFSLEK